jgi:hypothetical protein
MLLSDYSLAAPRTGVFGCRHERLGTSRQLDRNSFEEGVSRDLAKEQQSGVVNPGGK